MNGKKLILIIIVISLIAAILTWIYGQKLIDDLDLERAMETTTLYSQAIFRSLSI